jgi:hypothetical protein
MKDLVSMMLNFKDAGHTISSETNRWSWMQPNWIVRYFRLPKINGAWKPQTCRHIQMGWLGWRKRVKERGHKVLIDLIRKCGRYGLDTPFRHPMILWPACLSAAITPSGIDYSSNFRLRCINLCYQQPWVLFLLSISTDQSLKLCEAQEIQDGQLDRAASFLTRYGT